MDPVYETVLKWIPDSVTVAERLAILRELDKRPGFQLSPRHTTITEEDCKIAEFHGDPDDGLDWTENG